MTAAPAAPARGYELVTPPGSEAAEPTAVHPVLGGDGFSYQGYDGILGAHPNVWTAYTAVRGADGWDNRGWFLDAPLTEWFGGSNSRVPVATQPIGHSADGRTQWIATLLPLVADDENLAADYYAVTDGTPVLITRRPDGKAAGIDALADNHGGGDALVAVQGDRLVFSLAAATPIAQSGTGRSLFSAAPDGTVVRLDEGVGPAVTVLAGRPVSDDGTRVLYPKGGRQLLWDRGTIRDLGPWTVRNHLSRDGRYATIVAALPGDPFARVYRYDVEAQTTTLLSGAHDDAAPTVAASLVDTSDDGRVVVLRTKDPLTDDVAGAATGSDFHYYVRSGGTLRHLGTFATLGGSTALGPSGVRTLGNGTVVFVTTAALLAGDADAVADVYRWTPDGGLQLLSAGLAGGGTAVAVRFDGPATMQIGLGNDPQIIENERNRAAELTSADGLRVFFSSVEALTADAGDNGRDKVYGWDDGDLTLISPPGDDARPARYLGNNASGRDVFFSTDQALDPRDTDGAYADIYSARIGGGFAPPPGPPADPCPGNACPLPATPVGPAAPATTTAHGPEDPAPAGDPSNRFTLKGKGSTTLRIGVPGPGRVQLRATRKIGKRTRTVLAQTSTLTSAGNRRVRLQLSRTGRSALRRSRAGRMRLKVRITFEPEGGQPRTRTTTVTFHDRRRAR